MPVKMMLLLFATFVSLQVRAESTKEDRKDLKSFVNQFKQSSNFGLLLENIRLSLPPQTYAFLKDKAKGHEADALSKIVLVSEDEFSLEQNHKIYSMKITSAINETYLINRKPVDLSKIPDLQKRWEKVVSMLPGDKASGAFFQLFSPPAYAEASAPRITGGGAMAVGVSVLGAENVWNPVGWALIAAGGFLWNTGTCNEISSSSVTCKFWYQRLEEVLKENPKREEAMKSKAKRPECPTGKDASILENGERKELFEKFNDIVHGHEELSRKITICEGSQKEDLKKCITKVSEMSHYLCIDLLGLTTKYLPPRLIERPTTK